MELTHTFTVPAGPGSTWELLTDLDRVGSCFPGATVTEADAEEFAGTVKVKLGPIALTYSGTGRFVERDDVAHRAVIEARGKDKRGNGTASATVTMSLSGEGEQTRAEVLTDLSITGKPAQFGRGVMQDVSDKLLGQFVACIERQFREAPGGTAPPADAPDRPTGALADDTVPPVTPPAADAAGPARPDPDPQRPADDAALNLGSAVLPVLTQRYAGAAAAGLVGFAVGVLAGRAGRR